MDFISVLMSVYKEPLLFVDKAIKSILNQTYNNFELIIIVDNPNNSVVIQYLKNIQDPRVRIFINEQNLGLASSLNRAMKIAKGNYFARMDADDISKPKRLELELAYLKKNRFDMVSSAVERIDENDIVCGEISVHKNWTDKVNRILQVQNIIVHPSVLMKADVILSVGGYRNFATCQDYDLWLRLVSNGYKIGILEEKLLLFRIHANSVSSKKRYSQILNEIYIRQLYAERIKNNGKDSFSDESLRKFLSRYGCNNSAVVKKQSQQLVKYQTGIIYIKNKRLLKGGTMVLVSLTSFAVRESMKVSLKSKLLQKFY